MTMEDSYIQLQMGNALNNMLSQVQILGEGIVDNVAFAEKNQCLFLDAYTEDQTSVGQVTFQIAEGQGILDQTNRMFGEMENNYSCNSPVVPQSSSNSENHEHDRWFASFCNENIIPVHRTNYDDLKEVLYTPNVHIESSALVSDVWQGKRSSLLLESSCPTQHQISSDSALSFNNSGAKLTLTGMWHEGNSLSTSPELQSQCFPELASSVSCETQEQNYLQDSAFASLYKDNLVTDDFTRYPYNSCVIENLSEYFAPSLEQRIGGSETTISENFPSSLIGQVKSPVVDTAEHDPLEVFRSEYGSDEAGDFWKAMTASMTSGINSDICTDDSSCSSELGFGATVGSQKRLFSELGLEELLHKTNNLKHIPGFNIDDQFSTGKRKRVGIISTGTYSASSLRSQPLYELEKINSVLSKTELSEKSQLSSVTDDSRCISAGSATVAKPKKTDEPKKFAKKRARPGEGTRPRPKDRQLIQDRIKELRGIVPNGSKLSIDQLLDRAAKHMLFLQDATKLADKLKQAHEPKLIGKENGMLPKDIKTSRGDATWAMEVGNRTMFCPLIIEDLSTPGLMLIEMLCEDQGLFLEITDVIKGFSLNVLKGVMERREEKIWAHFVVEAKTPVTRIELFLDLSKFLKLTATSVMDSKNQPQSLLSGNIHLPDT